MSEPDPRGYAHTQALFDAEFRRCPDALESYAIRLEGVVDPAERQAIQRAGLRETIAQRWPLQEVRRVT